MSYYFSKKLKMPFNDAIEHVTQALARKGFGILTTIDVRATMKKKLDVDFRNYRILGACNPALAREALEIEDKVGTMLPCNVVIQDEDDGSVEVAAIDPVASMQAIDNPKLKIAAERVGAKLKHAIDEL